MPVAKMVTLASSPRESSVEVPHITSMSGSSWSKNSSISCISLTNIWCSVLAYMLNKIFLALLMSFPHNKGESRASMMALSIRLLPLALPIAMIAPPPLRVVVSTSRKSRLILPSLWKVISSDMPFTASFNTSSARLKASLSDMGESE